MDDALSLIFKLLFVAAWLVLMPFVVLVAAPFVVFSSRSADETLGAAIWRRYRKVLFFWLRWFGVFATS